MNWYLLIAVNTHFTLDVYSLHTSEKTNFRMLFQFKGLRIVTN